MSNFAHKIKVILTNTRKRLNIVVQNQIGQHKKVENHPEPNKSMDNQVEIERLSNWLDIIERDVNVHFNSWSWKIGWWFVKVIKIFILQQHRPSEHLRIQQILRAYRIWRSQHGGFGDHTVSSSKKKEYEYTLLPGRLDKSYYEKINDLQHKGSLQVIGFGSFAKNKDPDLESVDIHLFPESRFPEFYSQLMSAMLKASGKKVIISDCGLTSLGLGLLLNYHFGTPFIYIGQKEKEAGSSNNSWNDKALMDPFDFGWDHLLRKYSSMLPGDFKNVKPGVITAAAEFAESFSTFYRTSSS